MDGPTASNVWESDVQEYFDEVEDTQSKRRVNSARRSWRRMSFLSTTKPAGFDDNWNWVVGKATFDDVEDEAMGLYRQ